MSEEQDLQVALALDAGVRESGWAVFRNGKVEDTGVVGMKTIQRLDPEVRIAHLLAALEKLAANWRPQTIVPSRAQRHQLADAGARLVGRGGGLADCATQ